MPDDELTAERGLTVDGSDKERLGKAIELAFDYRGDVTIVRKSDGTEIEGYIFDRAVGSSFGESKVRIIPNSGGDRATIPYADIAELRFTGRDSAAGKSFETWMKKYVEKKLAGEEASIHVEPLEEE